MHYIVENPITLLEVLNLLYADSSNKTLRDMLKHGRVTVDDQVVVKASTIVEKGQNVRVGEVVRKVADRMKIIYDDRNLIVIDKAEGLLSVPLDAKDSTNALELLKDYFHTDEIYAVHRLDKESSGVMVFARGKKSAIFLNEKFKNHDLKRVYLAIVQGNLKESEGTWTSFLHEVNSYKVFPTTDESEGREAITHYRVVRRSKNFSFLELTLETGRKHQIRVHCNQAGHPIAGDRLYGVKSCNPILRMCLHSSVLEVEHPLTNKLMRFVAPTPRAFSRLGFEGVC